MPNVRHTATRDVITVLVQGWKAIVGCAVAFGLIALTLCLLQRPMYEATVTLYVTSGTSNQGPSSAYEDVMGAAGRVTSYAKLAFSDTVLAGAVKSSGLDMTMGQARKAVRAQAVPESEMLTVSARNPNRDVAKRFANAMADSMIDAVAALEVPNGGGTPTTRLTIVTPATLNPHPVSPTTLMNVTLAMLGGLLLGVATVLTRERFNNKVRNEADIENIVGARPLGQIPHDKSLRFAPTADFGGLGTAAPNAFRHLRTALSVIRSERSLSTFLVTSPRGGAGKSTVALNLAAALAESGNTVVLVDADLGNPAVARRTGNSEVPGLADVIHSQVPPLQLSVMGIDGLKVIGAGRMGDNDPAALLASSACGKFFEQLAESFDYVIVDSSSLLDGPEAEAAACWADGVLLVARQGRSKLSDCYAALTRLSEIRAELVGVVLNDVSPRGGHDRPAPAAALRPRRRRRSAPSTSTQIDEINVGVQRNPPDAAADADDREI